MTSLCHGYFIHLLVTVKWMDARPNWWCTSSMEKEAILMALFRKLVHSFMLCHVSYNCRLKWCQVFDRMSVPVGDSQALSWGWFLIDQHCYHFFNAFWKLQHVLGRGQDYGLEKWFNSRGHWHITSNFCPQSLRGRPLRVNFSFSSLPCS